ncbi:MAG: glycosyltransferase family 39 protein [Firmicutes bacterium]|nr:glycosyltransferase family 39 protein [Bacillota bacterium]
MEPVIKSQTDSKKRDILKEVGKIAIVIIAGLLISYFVRQPYLMFCGISPDSVLEMNIADNINNGSGAVLSIKTTYENDLPAIHKAFGEKGIVYPAALSYFIKKGWDLQWLNIILSFLCALILFFAVKNILDERTAWFSYILILFMPKLNLAASHVWNYTTILLFVVLVFLIFSIKNRFIAFPLAGLAAGSIIWADPWGIFLPLAFLPGVLFSSRNVKESLTNTLMFVFTGALAMAPPLFMLKSIQGHYLPSAILPYFQVQEYSSFLWNSYGFKFPGLSNFVFINKTLVKSRIAENLKIYSSFIASRQGLYLILPGVIPILFTLKSAYREFPARWMPALSFSLLSFAGSCILWSDRDFVKLPVYVFIGIIPAIIHLLSKIEIRKFPAGLMTASLLVLLTLNVYLTANIYMNRQIIESHNLRTLRQTKDQYSGWITAQGAKDSIYAASNPWIIYLQCKVPCGLMPSNINKDNIQEFQQKFGYNYFIANDQGENSAKMNDLLGNSDIDWIVELIPGLWRVQKL